MSRAMSTIQFRGAVSRARAAGLGLVPSPEFCSRLADPAVHCVVNHVYVNGCIRASVIFAVVGGHEDGEVSQIDMLVEDFNSLPTVEDVLKELNRAEPDWSILPDISPRDRQRLYQDQCCEEEG